MRAQINPRNQEHSRYSSRSGGCFGLEEFVDGLVVVVEFEEEGVVAVRRGDFVELCVGACVFEVAGDRA